MKTLNSISGGRTSAYLSAHYPADINIFSLVKIDNPDFLWMEGKDEKTRQFISDKIGAEFVGTAEMDTIIYTILDLEQFLGQEIKFVSGMSWEELIIDRKGFLPSYQRRFCTTEFKIEPIFNYLYDNNLLPIITRLGYRRGEERRRTNMLKRVAADGYQYHYKRLDLKPNSRYYNRELVKYRKCTFPLIENGTGHLEINNFWLDKPVRFADYNNCTFCVNRDPLFLSFLSRKYSRDYAKGIYLEKFSVETANKFGKYSGATFRPEGTLEKISLFNPQEELFPEDFNSCDSGYCGI